MAVFDIQSIFSVIDRTSGPASSMGRAIGGINTQVAAVRTGLSRMASTAVGVLGTLGIALGIGQAKHALIGLNAEMEGTTIGLATILSGSTGMKFADSLKVAESEFIKIRKLSLQTAATGSQLFDIYQQSLGAILGMGKGLEHAQQISFLTSIAASALRVDFSQAGRDLNQMLTGRAGMDVKLFQSLRASGFLKQTAEEFNKLMMTNPQSGLALLTAALEKIRPAAEAYGKSWEGLTSTFQDFMQNFSRIMGGGIFGALKTQLTSLNDFLLKNEDRISAAVGKFGQSLGKLFSLNDFLLKNEDRISAAVGKFGQSLGKLFTPEGAKTIGTVLAGAVGAKFGIDLTGGLIGGLSGIVGGVGEVASGGFAEIFSALGSVAISIPRLLALPVAALLLGSTIKVLVENTAGLRTKLQDVLGRLFTTGEGFIDTLTKLWPKISQVADVIGKWTVNTLIDVLEGFTNHLKSFNSFMKGVNWKEAAMNFTDGLSRLSGSFAALSAFFGGHDRSRLPTWQESLQAVWTAPERMAQAYWKTYTETFGKISPTSGDVLRFPSHGRGAIDDFLKAIYGSPEKLAPKVTVNQHIEKVQLDYNFDKAEPRIFRRFEKDLRDVARRGVQSIFALDLGP